MRFSKLFITSFSLLFFLLLTHSVCAQFTGGIGRGDHSLLLQDQQSLTITFIYNGEEVTYGIVGYAGRFWMDRNLGAKQVASSVSDPDAYGHYFQWGREADGHQLPDSEVVIDEYAPVGEQPGHDSFIRITPAEYPQNDWNVDNEWVYRWTDEDGNKTAADPCPPAWRVATVEDWEAAIDAGSWEFRDDAYASPLKISATGTRQNNAVFNQVGVVGYYAATPAYFNASRPRWEGGRFTTGATTAVVGSNYMAGGMAVRCVRYIEDPVAPMVETHETAEVNTNSALLQGQVISDGGSVITERGFYYGTGSDPATDGEKVSVEGTIGPFSYSLTSLDVNTTYFVQAFAVNDQGETRGEVLSFITQAVYWEITSTAAENGSITPEGTVSVMQGENQTFDITADEGYHIEDVEVDSQSVGAVETYTFENVTSDHSIHARFAVNTYIITASAGDNGSITPSGEIEVEHGDSKSFTFDSDQDYHISDVIVDGSSVGTPSSYTFDNVVENHTIEVRFAFSTDIHERDANHLNVYPNPVASVLNIQLPESFDRLVVLDMLGRVMHLDEGVSESGIMQLNVSSLPKGVYFVRIVTGERFYVARFLIE
jgi:hypothetical protein